MQSRLDTQPRGLDAPAQGPRSVSAGSDSLVIRRRGRSRLVPRNAQQLPDFGERERFSVRGEV